MNGLPFFLAQRILFSNVYKKNISTISTICFIGIFIGSFSLAVVTAIMRGFEVVIHNKIQGIHSHITIDAYGKPINFKAISFLLKKEFPEICAFSPHTERHILIHQYNSDTIPTVAIIKSIKPELEILTTSLFTKIIQPLHTEHCNQLLDDNKILIGKQYATSNNLSVGDTIELLFSQDKHFKGKTVTFDSQLAVIGGIFDTGIDEFDSNVLYCSFAFLKNIFTDSDVEQINIKLHNNVDELSIIKKLRSRLGLSVYSWKDLYPSLVATLKLEKYVSFFIIGLILLVASMNIISLIHMQITQKRRDIAILKALGMTNSAISVIFFITGLLLSLSASLFGLLSALIVSCCIKRYPFISLPDTYYTTHLPIIMEPYIILSVLFTVILFSFFAIYFSTKQIHSINTSQVLRFED
jgi:lipoprotein-releasing system permease protein